MIGEDWQTEESFISPKEPEVPADVGWESPTANAASRHRRSLRHAAAIVAVLAAVVGGAVLIGVLSKATDPTRIS